MRPVVYDFIHLGERIDPMSFESRKEKFLEVTSQFSCERPSPFLAIHPIRPGLYYDLLVAATIFISRCIPGQRVLLEDDELVSKFAEQVRAGAIWNCTPNGLLVPKRHLILEYNALVRAYINILRDMGIEDHILTLNPPSMRYKEGFQDIKPEKLARNYASEKVHLDSWTGDFAGSYNVSIPLFGDTGGNRVIWYSPPESFEESWLDYRPSYDAGAGISLQYLPFPIERPYARGYLYMADVAVLHCTTVSKGAGPRFTLDNLFSVTPPPSGFTGRLGPPYGDFFKDIGEKTLLAFPEALQEYRENRPNKLPLDPVLVKIL